GGTCIVRVTSSGFGTGAAWESEFWDDMGLNWMPFFDNLRLYLSHFPGQEATQLEVTASHPGDAETLWSTLHDAPELGDEGTTVARRGATRPSRWATRARRWRCAERRAPSSGSASGRHWSGSPRRCPGCSASSR